MQTKLFIFGALLTIGSLIPLYTPIGHKTFSNKLLSRAIGSAGIIFLLCAIIHPLQRYFTFIMLVWMLIVSSTVYYLDRKTKIEQHKNEKVRYKHEQKRKLKEKSTSLNS